MEDDTDRLRMVIKKLVRGAIDELLTQQTEELEEISSTDASPGYLTPMSFAGNHTEKQKKNSEQLGYTLTQQGKKSMGYSDKLTEGRTRYHEYKGDPRSPRHKIGRSMSEINRHLSEIERMVRMNTRLKRESGLESAQYWKQTMHQIGKLEQKLIRIAEQLREMKI